MQDRVLTSDKIEILWNTEIREIIGTKETGVESIRIFNNKTGETASFPILPDDPPDPGRPGAGRPGPTAPADLVAARRESLGLNDPLWQQYVDYLHGLFTGDLGTSLVSQLPVVRRDRAAAAGHALSWRCWRSWRPCSSPSRSASRWAC